MTDSEPDYLDYLIQESIDNDPGFAEMWAPIGHMIELSRERARLGLSLEDMAERMGTSRSAVTRMEVHPEKVSFVRILRYARVLGMEFVLKPAAAKPEE